MELEEVLKDIRTKAVVPLWPVGMVLNISRGSNFMRQPSEMKLR